VNSSAVASGNTLRKDNAGETSVFYTTFPAYIS